MKTICTEKDTDGYERFLSSIQDRFNTVVHDSEGGLFTTTADGLFDLFLENIPSKFRQEYTCNACRKFVDGFGGLVTIGENGEILPVMWGSSDVPLFFLDAVKSIEKKIIASKVTGIFYSNR